MAYTSSGAQTAWRSVASKVKQTSSLTPSPCGPFSSLRPIMLPCRTKVCCFIPGSAASAADFSPRSRTSSLWFWVKATGSTTQIPP